MSTVTLKALGWVCLIISIALLYLGISNISAARRNQLILDQFVQEHPNLNLVAADQGDWSTRRVIDISILATGAVAGIIAVSFLVANGRPLMHDGKYAAFRRINKSGDIRSNMHSSGKSEPVEIDDQALQLVEMVRLKLVEDGMFLVGLDIVKDKLMEINVFSPGGLGSAQQHTNVDFAPVVIRDIERKVNYKQYYGANVSNVRLATI